jgi:hypothetical protein
MRRAWENTKRKPITAADASWTVEPVFITPAKQLSVETLETQLKNRDPDFLAQGGASRLAWLRRCQANRKIDVGCLELGNARILYVPGELFVEYQLAAKAERPDLFVAVAAYGDYAPWYIGTAAAYAEGGYETSPTASNVGPEAESVLLPAMRKLLRAQP